MTQLSQPDLDSSSERLVGLGQLVVGTAEVLVLNLQLSELGVVLLLGATELRLVLGLDVDDRPLQFLGAPQAALPEHTRRPQTAPYTVHGRAAGDVNEPAHQAQGRSDGEYIGIYTLPKSVPANFLCTNCSRCRLTASI